MNADAFRYLFGYHFAQNREMWDKYIAPLTYEQFTRKMGYSYGSVRDQIVHLMGADDMWFAELRNAAPAEPPPPAASDDREALRAHWDRIEQGMRDYLAKLQDDMLFSTPIMEPDDDRGLIVWQVLLHVANHGTDHRAQTLRFLSDLGVKTVSQDLIFYIFDHPVSQ